MRTLILAAALGLTASLASAIPPIIDQPPPAPPPRLTLVISVEGLTTEMLDRHRGNLHGGLGRLLTGASFRNMAAGESLRPMMIADILQDRNPASLTVAVAGAQPSAVRIGGQSPDQRWFWQGQGFASDLAAPVPQVIGQANAAIKAMIAAPQPGLVPPLSCAAATPSANRFARAAGDAASFAASPAMDGAVLASSAALIKELGLGRDVNPDVAAISLPATAAVASRSGGASEAICLQILSLDRDLQSFFDLLDREGQDYAVVLRGSSAAGAVPLLFWRKGLPATVHDQPVQSDDVDRTVAAQLGIARVGNDGPGECLKGISGIACLPR